MKSPPSSMRSTKPSPALAEIHLFDAPWGPEHARRALCGGLREVDEPEGEVVAVAWAHPEVCPTCVAVARERPAKGERVALRAPRGTVVRPAPVYDLKR